MPETILLTGATDGIGRAAARRLAADGVRVLAHGRDPAKGRELLAELRALAPQTEPAYYNADLASLAAVEELADALIKQEPRLDGVIANAGVYLNERENSAEGYEKVFAVNQLAHFLLINRLVYPLARNEPARIVVVASLAHGFVDELPSGELADPSSYDALTAYARSKGANIAFTLELARRLTGSGITCTCLHPGVIGTKLYHAGWGSGGAAPEEGAARLVHAARVAEAATVHGRYLEDDQPVEPAAYTRDPGVQRELWRLCERLSGLA
jgi:NAD(P)-dependent dehydrogenase (short-subunit alcohol dehydrogenase family)